jgi:hypothetical protein
MGIGQVKKMYREHKEYAAEDGWLRQMEDYEHRPDMLTCYENIIGEACPRPRHGECSKRCP